MFCAVVRAGVRCCACALLGLRVARAPCPGVLLRRRGDTPSLWRARLAPWRALLALGCGLVRGSGVCVRWGGGGGSSPLDFPALSLCPSSPARPACLPSSYPLGWPWLDGWSWWSDMVFLFCRAAWAGFVLGAGCSCGVPCRVYGVLGLLAPVHQRACPVCGVACAVSWVAWLLFTCVPASVCCVVCTAFWAPWLRFTGVHALCAVLCVRCPGPPGSCSPVRVLIVLCRLCRVPGFLAPVLWPARSVCGVVCVVSWAFWPFCAGVLVWPPGSCSPVCTLCEWCCVYVVLGLLAPVHRCARSVPRFACTVSWASSLLFTGVQALCVVLRVRRPGPPGACSVCMLCVWCCVYGVLGLLAPVHRCARSVCGVACTASWASLLLFTGVHALCVVLRVRCPGPRGSCSPLCTLCVWCCVYGVPGLLATVQRCARSVCAVVCTVPRASWLLFTSVHALSVVLCVRCPWPPGSCSPVCTLCVWCCVYGVLGLLAPVHRCARSVCGVACTVSRASWLLFTGVHALSVVLRVWCPGPPGSCSPVCTLCVWCCVYGVLGLLAPVHRCARPVCGGACMVSWASWLLFTGVHALCVVLCVRCPGPPGSCSPVCTLSAWCCVYGVLGLLAPVHRCARSVCGVVCTASWASWLPFTGVYALCVVLRVRFSGPPGSCSPVCTLYVWCCVYGVLGLLAPVHRCARSVCGVVCAVSWVAWLLFTCVPAPVCCDVCTAFWAPWLRFTGVHALCAVLCVRCPGPLGSCSPVRVLVVLCRLCRVPGFLAPVLWPARSVCGVVCVVSWAFWPFCAGVLVWCVLCCVCGVLGHLVRVLWCRGVLRCVWCPVCGVACAVSSASRPLLTGAHARCVVLCGRCPGPLGSCSPVCSSGVLCGVCGVLGHLAAVHRCARVACVVSRVRCPGPRGSRSTACCVLVQCVVCCVRVLGHVAPVHQCACSVCCVVCAVWVWVRARVRHTVAATLRTLCLCLHMNRHLGKRRSEVATGIPATKASGILWSHTYSSRPGLFDFGDAQE